jgi:hypothetical protein
VSNLTQEGGDMAVRYNRGLSKELLPHLLPEGRLRFLVEGLPLPEDDPYALDIQIREHDQLMYYHGTTRLLVLHFKDFKNCNANIKISPSAHKAYGAYSQCKDQWSVLNKKWDMLIVDDFHQAFSNYLVWAIKAAEPKYYKNQKEGFWQNRLCVRFGKQWRPGDEWLILDRECVLGFDSEAKKESFYQDAQNKYCAIKMGLQREDQSEWGKPKNKGFGDELDMLGIGSQNQLVTIELKHGKNSSGIYWGPLQVAMYQKAFFTAIEDSQSIMLDIKELARQKVQLGLLPEESRKLIEECNLNKVEPVLAVAEPNQRSKCWKKMTVVMEEMKRAGIVSPSLPL